DRDGPIRQRLLRHNGLGGALETDNSFNLHRIPSSARWGPVYILAEKGHLFKRRVRVSAITQKRNKKGAWHHPDQGSCIYSKKEEEPRRTYVRLVV
ncbi:MAG: hypothetical protein LBU28_06965, partial [Spirochaetaceae bacterium]|nr:hypothetical protein [Spirochaetaceae bacterium]